MLEKKKIGEGGMITPVVLIMLTVFVVFGVSVLSWTMTERKNVVNEEHATEALQVAEAGINYYKWHLAHSGDDYKDGKTWCCNNDDASTPSSCGGKCGPYVETYKDYDGNTIGEFSLTIMSPRVGSTIVDIESVGKLYSDPDMTKKITAKLGKRSLATYSMLGNSPIWIGENESTSGPLHSNGGIRFDGDCNAEVTSAVPSYDTDEANHGDHGTQDGIWGDAEADCQQYWSYPEANIDFDLFTLDMGKIKQAAEEEGGIYLGPSGREGYRLVFRNDGKLDIYMVRTVTNKVKYYNDAGRLTEDYEMIQSTTFIRTQAIPGNGVIFVEDDVWTEGVVNGRVTLAASRFTETATSYARIIIDGNLTYLERNGDHVLGLMAEGDILVPKHGEGEQVIDAVMLSQKGHVYRRLYQSQGVKESIEVYGGIITNLFWTWTWVDGDGKTTDGYKNTNTIYDSHLTYSPPPMFPTTEDYEIISFSEER